MLIRWRHGWEIPESEATPERVALGRRSLLGSAAALGLGGSAVAARAAVSPTPAGVPTGFPGPMAAPVDPRFLPGRAFTPSKDVYTYNNYYEFGSQKNIWREAQRLPLHPWSITIDGLVEQKQTIGLEDLLKQVSLQERLYRHRCVEAWALTIPWTGLPLKRLLEIAKPLSSAKYIVFRTDENHRAMPGLREVWYPWPYVEGLTMFEASNDLAILAVGLYGQPLKPQNGGPIRLVVPWKYGFKSAKAIVQVTFAAKRPLTFWEEVDGREYGFWANVNPAVPHPRWSQARERLIGFDKVVPTQIYNGYGEWVAGMYKGIKGQQLFR
ncbi:MAG: protein-methionine-sulfoxide reductase catalytic subunit MsrP [Rhodospirillales bacterium]|nr:protein-methionine-sulfoxide reductase catalytic subunit MsrP [Rhodospirillales bacterium]